MNYPAASGRSIKPKTKKIRLRGGDFTQTRIKVLTLPNSATICLDNYTCVKTPVVLEVPRSYSDFRVVVKNESIEKTIQIRSRVSLEFKWGNLLFSVYSPIGYIIDATSRKKMYSYDNSILVDLSNNINGYKKWGSLKRVNFTLCLAPLVKLCRV